MKLSDTLLQQDGLSMAHDGATYCGTRGEYTFLILMGRNELVVSVLRGGEEPDKGIQKKWFVAQLDLARRLKLPVIIQSAAGALRLQNGGDARHLFSPPRRCGEKLCREDPRAPAGASLVPA